MTDLAGAVGEGRARTVARRARVTSRGSGEAARRHARGSGRRAEIGDGVVEETTILAADA